MTGQLNGVPSAILSSMRNSRIRILLGITTIVAIVWFQTKPVIRFQPGQAVSAMTASEVAANGLVAVGVAMLVVVAVTSIGRATGLWKD